MNLRFIRGYSIFSKLLGAVALGALSLHLAACATVSGEEQDDDEARDPTAEVAQRVHRTGDACLDADFTRLPCTEDANPMGYTPDGGIIQAGRDVITPGVEAIPFVFGPARLIMALRGDEGPAARFRTEIRSYLQRLQAKIQHDHLDACHSACVVQCLTSQLLTYDDEQYESFLKAATKPADLGPDYAAGSGKGICRNYGNLAEELGAALGLDLNAVTTRGGNHVMVRYAEGGHRYMIEPQKNPLSTGSCERITLAN